MRSASPGSSFQLPGHSTPTDPPPLIGPPEAGLAAARYLNARAWSIFGGTSEIQLTILAKMAVGL